MTLALPYRDDTRTPLAFSLAVLLHILLAMAVVGFFLFKTTPTPAQNKVFELVAAPSPDSAPDEAAAPGPPSLTVPKISTPNIPATPQTVQATPTPAPPTPAPTVVNRQSAPPTPPKPTPTRATTVQTKPPAKQPQMTDYQKFVKEQHLSNSPATTRGPNRPVPAVSVNVSSIVKNLQNGAGGANGQARGRASSASSAAEQNYIDMLRERLREVFVPPGGITGLSAEVLLVIAPDGSLVVKRISRPSGKAEFDDAVNAALKQLTNVDPPPGGAQVSYNFTYTPEGE